MNELKKPAPTVAIIDYEMGNLFSVARACELAGLRTVVTSQGSEIEKADGVILPGVGAFGDAMRALGSFDLITPVKEYAASGKPLLGICLGMQLLMTESDEFGLHRGLDIFKGRVVRFDNPTDSRGKMKVPQIGWNKVYPGDGRSKWNQSLLHTYTSDFYLYFVHSYYVVPENPEVVIALSRYGNIEFCSCLGQNNIFACQAHPEKSGPEGLGIYRNFAQLLGNNAS